MDAVSDFRKRSRRLRATGGLLGAAVLVGVFLYPPAILLVFAVAGPMLGLAIWQMKCPHCDQRLVANGAAFLEWQKKGLFTWEPSRCPNAEER